ncbi:MAG: sulfate adenylyltransferase subunit 1 [Clostridiaceae bacterium]
MSKVDNLKFVIVGHVDHGKSSLIGRLLYDSNSIAADKIEELKKSSKLVGKEIEFAFLLDHLKEEREQGITIDTTQTFFKTQNREYVIIDAPGHIEFIKNMITGASQAEAAILIIDAKEKIQEQTKRHAFILSLLGIKQVMVVINKMDLVDYREDIFNELVSKLKEFLNSLNLEAIQYIPISAINGDNVSNRSSMMEWYKGESVLEILETLEGTKEDVEKTTLFPIQDVYKIDDKRISVGRLETGKLKKGDKIKVLPSCQETTVKTIEKFMENCEEALSGESIGITTESPVFLERGNIICSNDNDFIITDCFKASLFWMNNQSLKLNEKMTIKCATQEVQCELKEITRKINSSTLNYIDDDLKTLNNLEVGDVILKTKKPLVISKFKDNKAIGRFVIVKDNNICAGGIITNIDR